MKYPNAAKGISKIFTSVIMNVIASVATSLVLVLSLILSDSANAENVTQIGVVGIGLLVFVMLAGVFSVIALIFMIVGVVQTAKDEKSFSVIIYLLVLNIIIDVITLFFDSTTTFHNICLFVSQLLSLICSLLMILGIARIADKLNNSAVNAKCADRIKLVFGVGLLSLLIRFLSIFMLHATTAGFAVGLIIASLLFALLQYIFYLSVLSSAKKMFTETNEQ